MLHGGPTAAASLALNLKIQLWTSRGFAVLDVNYSGSSGYGRQYRLRLNGNWGVLDVEDCIQGANYLAAQGRVDGKRMSITGGSAGGYTALCALAFHDAFTAGVSRYGIGSLETLAIDTHKFESHYLDNLVGPYPAASEVYRQRSPIHFIDQINAPILLLQGSEDKVVPPIQSERMYQALAEKGLPVAYLLFEGEQHGFRKAGSIKRALEIELYFYSRIFGFPLTDVIDPIEINNLKQVG
jgi:dipeptidyl aminopeptidase/acylaminoacyl peptidase